MTQSICGRSDCDFSLAVNSNHADCVVILLTEPWRELYTVVSFVVFVFAGEQKRMLMIGSA